MELDKIRDALHDEYRDVFIALSEARRKTQKHLKCLVPHCGLSAINSHSQQKSVALRAIAIDGHVLSLKRDTTFSEIRKVGINEASTFKGFCNKHDTELFKALETFPLSPGNPDVIRQAFLRATAHEMTRKYEVGSAFAQVASPEDDEAPLTAADLWETYPGIESKFSTALSNTEPLEWVWATTDKNVGVALCTAFSLPKNERWVQHIPECLATCNIIPTTSCTHFIFAWPATYNQQSRQLKRMLKHMWHMTLNGLIFYMSEDYSLAPNLLDEQGKEKANKTLSTFPPLTPSTFMRMPDPAQWHSGTIK